MARLNEVPAAPDNGETLRKRLFRQNRDLARSNNVRALRIKELENNFACMLSENLELRARIIDLESQLEDGGARRIADHALAIRAKIEAQLEEWGGLIAGLGLEPPVKRQSPDTRRSTIRRRTSFVACRPSPSQRRLRGVAREVEELGYIPENKSGPRRSMNQEQILALRSEADISIDSMELGPPPVSHYLEGDPAGVLLLEDNHVEHPAREPSPGDSLEDKIPESPMHLASPNAIQDNEDSPETVEEDEQPTQPPSHTNPLDDSPSSPTVQAPRVGSKRKLAAGDNLDGTHAKRILSAKVTGTALSQNSSSRQTPTAKSLKETPVMKGEVGDKDGSTTTTNERKPLANKSTNDDVMGYSSLKKSSKTMKAHAVDEGPTTKKQTQRSRPARTKTKNTTATFDPNVIPAVEEEHPIAAPETRDLATPIEEPVLLAPNTPEPAAATEAPRGDTPPPADLSAIGERMRPSRRNRASISYAEPNLRDKMRRLATDSLDAVAGQGRFAEQARRGEAASAQSHKMRALPETSTTPNTTIATTPIDSPEPETIPGSTNADSEPPIEDLPSSVTTERRRRPTVLVSKTAPAEGDSSGDDADQTGETLVSDLSDVKETDVYEFTSSPPRVENMTTKETKRSHRRQTASSRRSSTAAGDGKDRGNNRRKSMMV